MGYANSKTNPKHRDLMATPPWLFLRIQQVLCLTIAHDVCAQRSSAKCASYWTKNHNALTRDWSSEFPPLTPVYMNPPYSQLPEFTAKAVEQASKGLIVVGLVPDTPSSKWYRDHLHGIAASAYRPDGRISFIKPNGKKAESNMFPSIVPVWTPWQTGQTSYAYFDRYPQQEAA